MSFLKKVNNKKRVQKHESIGRERLFQNLPNNIGRNFEDKDTNPMAEKS